MIGQQTCKVCGRVDKFNFYVPDEVWVKIVPIEYQNLVVCLSCFDGFACAKSIYYAQFIKELYFVGEGTTTIRFRSSHTRARDFIDLLSGAFTNKFQRMVEGSIQDSINQHGMITPENKGSVAKRITSRALETFRQEVDPKPQSEEER